MNILGFARAFELLQGMNNGYIKRSNTPKDMRVKIQYPTEENKLKNPRLVVVHDNGDVVECLISQESLFATDWEVYTDDEIDIEEE